MPGVVAVLRGKLCGPLRRRQSLLQAGDAVTKVADTANAKAQRMTRKLEGNTNYVPRELTLTPKVTHGHKGYATGSIVVKAPKGTAPVVGSFVAKGAAPCAITITSATVVLSRNAYVIRFRAPTGDLGHAGRLTVTLISA